MTVTWYLIFGWVYSGLPLEIVKGPLRYNPPTLLFLMPEPCTWERERQREKKLSIPHKSQYYWKFPTVPFLRATHIMLFDLLYPHHMMCMSYFLQLVLEKTPYFSINLTKFDQLKQYYYYYEEIVFFKWCFSVCSATCGHSLWMHCRY